MIVQDSLAVIKYQAAARNRGVIVAAVDVVIWYVSITSTTIAAFTFHGANTPAKIAVAAAVTAANIIGNLLGTYFGRRFIADHGEDVQNDKLQSLEERIARLEKSK